MEPIQPFWFKQRQAKLESAGDHIYKVVAPNQGEAYLLIRLEDNHRWSAAVRQKVDGADIAKSVAEFSNQGAAWEAAFELYRRAEIV